MEFGFERIRLGRHEEPSAKWEFGSRAWCEACARAGVRLLEDAELSLESLEWGFSEIYTHCPARLMEGREQSAYHIMVAGGQITGGGGAPAACRALPGFHVKIPWASIASQSAGYYGREGQALRSADEKVMWREVEEALGRVNPLGLGGGPPAVWPGEIAAALGKGAEEGGGLHNISASMLIPSPEVACLPLSKRGVPVLSRMGDAQRAGFLKLLGL